MTLRRGGQTQRASLGGFARRAIARGAVLPLRLLAARVGELETLDYEADRWVGQLKLREFARGVTKDRFAGLVLLYPEFRSLVHFRIRTLPIPLRLLALRLYPRERTLHIVCDRVGAGLIIQHGFATTITAESIGDDCWINQQVTIGWTDRGRPTIGDRVRIAAGAIVVGPITIGNDAQIGANATVMRDVPAGAHMIAPLAVPKQ